MRPVVVGLALLLLTPTHHGVPRRRRRARDSRGRLPAGTVLATNTTPNQGGPYNLDIDLHAEDGS